MKFLKKEEKGSFTVEASLIMPVVLACIFLILIMNFYLHDQVVLDSLVTELVHSSMDSKDVKKEFKSAANEKTLLLKEATCSYKGSVLQKSMQWKKTMTLPVSNFLYLILKTPKISVAGGSSKPGWNMTEIMRIKQAADEGGT